MKTKDKLITILVLVSIILAGVIWLSQYMHNNELVYKLIQDYGYLAIVAVGVIGGLNTLIPVPAATLTPIFLNAGLNFYTIVLLLSLGTLIADFISYTLGYFSKGLIKQKYPKVTNFFWRIRTKHRPLLIPAVFLYAAIIPFPNEVILIPLALSGYKFKYLLLPLIFGNLINQGVLSLGFSSIFDLIF